MHEVLDLVHCIFSLARNRNEGFFIKTNFVQPVVSWMGKARDGERRYKPSKKSIRLDGKIHVPDRGRCAVNRIKTEKRISLAGERERVNVAAESMAVVAKNRDLFVQEQRKSIPLIYSPIRGRFGMAKVFPESAKIYHDS